MTQTHRGFTALLLAGAVLAGVHPAAAAPARNRTVPVNTIVRVRLDEELSSRDVRLGDTFEATLARSDRSGFPAGTRFQGSITEVQRATKTRPAVLNMKFHRAILPDGRLVAATGFLASLEEDDVRRTANGRLESRAKKGSGKFDLKWVGYGAAGGAVLSTVLGGGFSKGLILGALGGAVYSYLNKDKGKSKGGGEFREVELSKGTEFGVRLYDRVAFNDSDRYRYESGEVDDRDYDREDRDYREDRRRDEDRDYRNDRDYREDRPTPNTEREVPRRPAR